MVILNNGEEMQHSGNDIKSVKEAEITKEISKLQKKTLLDDAISVCKNALDEDPTNAKYHVFLGDLYMQKHLDIYNIRQYVDEAITEYQRALEANLDSDVIHYKLGVAFYHKGELDKAINNLDIAIKYRENYGEAYYMKARALTRKDKLLEAADVIELAIKYLGIHSSEAHNLCATLNSIVYRSGFAGFLKRFKHRFLALLLFPFSADAIKIFREKISNLINFTPTLIMGAYYERTGAQDLAIELYINKLEEAPGFLELYIILGNAYQSIGKFEEAINEYRMAIWHDPLNIMAYRSLCQLYERIGETDRAIETYQKLIKMQPSFSVYYCNIAHLLYAKGEIDEAIKYYQNAITLSPNRNTTGVLAQMLGYVFHQSGENLDAAICAYQNAQSLIPYDMDTYISLGSVFYDKGDYQNALSIYKLALGLDPKNARIHCNLAYLLWGLGEIDESVKEYKLALKYDSDYDIAYNNLGVIYLDDLGKVKEAIDCFEKATQANPNYALAYYNLARSMVICGDKIEAAKLYQIAYDINKITVEMDPADIQEKLNSLFE